MNRLTRALALAALVSLGACGSSSNEPPLPDGDARDGAHEASSDGADAAAGLDAGDALAAGDGADAADAPADGADAPPAATTGAPNPCAPGAAWFDLPYTVASAAYARGRGLLFLRPETEHAIYLLDPDTCGAARIPVPRPPLSIAVSPDEASLAVGHDGLITVIDVASGDLRAALPIPAPATEIAFDAAGHVLVFSRALAGVDTQLLVVEPASGAVTAAGALDGGGHLAATADGAGVFWTSDDQTSSDFAARVVVGRSPLLGSPVAAGPAACHALFPTDDGRAVVTGCGTVLGLAPGDAATDLAPAGALAGASRVAHADTLAAKGLLAAIRAGDVATTPPPDGSLRIYTTKDLAFVGEVPLPVLDTGQEQQTPHGRYVFLRKDGARAYVVARRQPGQAPVDGVAALDPARATAADNAPTLPIAGSFPHRSGLPQPVYATRVAATVSFRVTDAGYSRALDRLVMSSTKPADAVALVDPTTGASEALPAVASPSTVAVRSDGLVAAVTRAGGVTFYDLQKRAVLRAVDGPATSVAFGAGSEVLLATDASTSSWLDLDTGAVRAGSTTAGEMPGFAAVPGTSRFYSMRERALVRHDDTIAAGDPTFDLSAFASPESSVKPCATPFWITEDGSTLVLDCSRAFALSADRAHDLRYLGFFEAVSRLDDIAYAPTTHRFFSAPEVFVFSDGLATAIGRIAVHDDQSLNLVASVDLGTFPGTAALSRPLRVFMGQTPRSIIVVAQADTFTTPSHAVYTLDVSGL
jgi:hypothetical protein